MANHRKNVTGEKRGRLTAIAMGEPTKDKKSTVICRCDCGNVKTITLSNFGKTLSCGCLAREIQRAHGKKMIARGICKSPDAKDLTGKRFNLWIVVSRAQNKNGRIYWNCRCECGTERPVLGQNLVNGTAKSCGCLNRLLASKRMKQMSHRDYETGTRLYEIWKNMKARCSPRDTTGRYYSRGIRVCDEWKNNYAAFMNWAIQNGYTNELTIDRINNDKGYYPENCRWATYKEQGNNKSTNRHIVFNGVKKTMSQWADELNLSYSTIKYRVNNGLPLI